MTLPLEQLNEFVQQVQKALMGGSREVRLDMKTAQSYSAAITSLISDSASQTSRIQSLQEQLLKLHQEMKEQVIQVETNSGTKW